jgi:2'-5' RNA ligase
MTPLIHSIWLLPKTEDETLLAEVVAELSRRFDTPLFAPHLTMKGDTDLPLAALEAAIAEAAGAVAIFAETVSAIETSQAYFRSFYARFAVSAPLARLKQRLDAPAADAFMPHVSLLYGPVAPEPKAAAAEEVGRRLKGRAISFDRLCVVRSGQDIPIADWRVVATARLG